MLKSCQAVAYIVQRCLTNCRIDAASVAWNLRDRGLWLLSALCLLSVLFLLSCLGLTEAGKLVLKAVGVCQPGHGTHTPAMQSSDPGIIKQQHVDTFHVLKQTASHARIR